MKTSISVTIAAFVVAASGCAGPPVGRSGAAAEPVTLHSAWGQGPDGIGGDVLAALVDETADGPVKVASGELVAGTVPSDNELDAIRSVIAGDADVTVVRVGAVQELGAESLAPLTAPFVVTNNDQAAAVAADRQIEEAVTADLDSMNLVAVALVPGGLRHPFGYGDHPLLTPSDYRDQAINIRRDAGVSAILSALGATPDYSVDSDRNARATDGRLRGIEVSIQQRQAVSLPAQRTANVTLYAKFDVVLVRKGVWDGLSTPQREALRDSVEQAVSEALAARPTEGQAQADWCMTTGATTVLASQEALASLHALLEPVTEGLAQDTTMAAVIARMRELHAGTTDPAPGACQGPVQAEPRAAYWVKPKGDQGVLNGTWRLALTYEGLVERGLSAEDARLNEGVWEFSFEDGYADGIQPDGRPCNATYSISQQEFSLEFGVRGVDDCGGLMRGTWVIKDDRLFLRAEKEMEYDVLLDQAMFEPGMVRAH